MRKYMYLPLIPIVAFAMVSTPIMGPEPPSQAPTLLLAVDDGQDKVTPKSSVLEGSSPLQNSSPLVAALPQQQAGPINVPLIIGSVMSPNMTNAPYDYTTSYGPGLNYVAPSEQVLPQLPSEQETALLTSNDYRSNSISPNNNAPLPPQVFNSAQQSSLSPN